MVALKSLLALGLAASLTMAAPSWPPKPSCGDLDIIFTGLPPYHPLVTAQGFDPAAVDAALRGDAAEVVKAGYNLRGSLWTGHGFQLRFLDLAFLATVTDTHHNVAVVLMGPEQPLSVLSGQMDGINWDGTGVGYGVRGSSLENLTLRFAGTFLVQRLFPFPFPFAYQVLALPLFPSLRTPQYDGDAIVIEE
ncbi:hypothetical protein LTS15_000314 [Exophiala xenobiotica]|nr:hypothetical protein LTS15_000314 [Exophiala xenobiotica]